MFIYEKLLVLLLYLEKNGDKKLWSC